MSKKEEKKNQISLKTWIGVVIGVVVVVLAIYFMLPQGPATVDTSKGSVEAQVAQAFNCEGKNTFQSDCWKKIQVLDKKTVYEVAPGFLTGWTFAFMNKDAQQETFGYTLSSLTSADLVRAGCPKPSDA